MGENEAPIKYVSSTSAGVKPMSIVGRFHNERERLAGGMTDADRAWRKKWLADQHLSPREPVGIDAYSKDLLNPFRRAMRFPLDFIFGKIVAKATGAEAAHVFRVYTGKFLIGVAFCYCTFYYFKYNTNTWESRSGWRVYESRDAVFPCDEGYPVGPKERKSEEFAERGFNKSIWGKKYYKTE